MLADLVVGSAWIAACLVAGNRVSGLLAVAGFPVPGNVIGLLLLFACLKVGLVRLCRVEKIADWLIRHLGLFFVPAGVGLIEYSHELGRFWFAIVIATISSTFLVLVATGLMAQATAKKK